MGLENNIPADFDSLEKYAPTLATIPNVLLWEVPASYFDGLPATVISIIHVEVYRKPLPFSVPEGYFESLQPIVKSQVYLEKLRQPSLFNVPEGYFEGLPVQVSGMIRLEAIKQQEGFAVPNDYFDGLADNIQRRIQLETLKNKDIYSVPDAYFDTLPDLVSLRIQHAAEHVQEENTAEISETYFQDFSRRVMGRIHAETNTTAPEPLKGKVMSLFDTRQILRYAAAACIGALVCVAGWLYIQHPTTPEVAVTTTKPNAEPEQAVVEETSVAMLLSEQYGIEEADLKEALESDQQTSNAIPVKKTKENKEVDVKNEIQEYLLDNNIDINALSSEL